MDTYSNIANFLLVMVAMYQDVDAQYYGFRDDDDGLLVPMEVVAEKVVINNFLIVDKDIFKFYC